MEKVKLILSFIVENRFIIAFIILFMMLVIQLILVFPLLKKFKDMESIPVDEAIAETRFNELNKRKNSSSSFTFNNDNSNVDL